MNCERWQGDKCLFYLLQQYPVHSRHVGDIAEKQSAEAGRDTDAHDWKLSVCVLERCLNEFPYMNIRHEIPEMNILIDLKSHVILYKETLSQRSFLLQWFELHAV